MLQVEILYRNFRCYRKLNFCRRCTYNPYSAANRGNITLNGTASNIVAFTDNTIGKGYIYHNGTDFEILNTSAGVLKFSTNGTERMNINNSGNATFLNNLGIGYAVQTNIKTYVYDNSADYGLVVQQDGAGIPFQVSSAGSLRMIVANNGNVGIGTISPSAAAGTALAIYGGASQSRLALKNSVTGDGANDGLQIGVGTDGGAFIEQRENNYIILSTNAVERMRITSAGNVVINSTTTPYVDDKLYIAAGNAIIDNNKSYLQYTNGGARAAVLTLNSSNNLFVGQNNANNANLFLYGGTGNVIVNAGAIEVARFTTSGNVGIGTVNTNRSGLGIDHTVLTVGTDAGMGMLELQGTRTSDADLGRIAWLNAGTRRSEIVVSRIDENTSTKMSFRTSNAGSLSTKMTIAKDGNVGIGTTSPNAKLHVGTRGTAGALTVAAGDGLLFDVYNDGPPYTRHGSIISQAADASEAVLDFWTKAASGTNSRKMTINGAGNVGIGGSPNNFTNQKSLTINGISGGNSRLDFQINGTNEAEIVANDAELIMAHNDILKFYTANTERMRITSGGNILAGKIVTGQVLTDGFEYSTDNYLSICNSVSANYSLYVANKGASGTRNMVAFYGTSSVVGSITYNGTVIAYNTTSDYRLKEDLKDFNGLDKVSKISVYDFKWKSEESRSYGVMAHELQEVLPDAVSGEKDAEENQMVDYSKIVPLLVKSIQELTAKVEMLEKNCNCKN
jgi:hypothetical protein